MAPKRDAEPLPAKKSKVVVENVENVSVPVSKPVGAERQAEAASLAASSGPSTFLAPTQDRAIIRFPEGEAAAKAFGGEQLRVLMEVVADNVCHSLGIYIRKKDLPTWFS